MITVQVTYHQHQLTTLHISGHALFANVGQDIVCAGVSSIVFGGLNALEQLFPEDSKLQVLDNAISMHNPTPSATIVLQVIFIQLQTIAESYPQYLRIQIRKEK